MQCPCFIFYLELLDSAGVRLDTTLKGTESKRLINTRMRFELCFIEG